MRFELRPTADGSLTVYDREAGECFKSRHAARSECEHVFYRPAVLENPAYAASQKFDVLELGFGLGTNFLHFLDRGFRGTFISIERDLAGVRFFLEKESNAALSELVNQGSYQSENCTACIEVGDFFDRLREFGHAGSRFHAILFDPFSPKANPDAWTAELFALCHSVLVPGGRLVTYSVSRAAKDAANKAGFRVEKHDLPPELHKRSALLAIRAEDG